MTRAAHRLTVVSPQMAGVPPPPDSAIVNLNVGGSRFSTSRQTLSWVPETFFTSLLSGRVPTVRDETGSIFIDRDPEVFRVILNYLRTRQVDLGSVPMATLKHEAQFYGIAPLVKRLTLCEELEVSNCGSVLFHGMIPPPTLPVEDESPGSSPEVSQGGASNASDPSENASGDRDRSSSAAGSEGGGGGAQPGRAPLVALVDDEHLFFRGPSTASSSSSQLQQYTTNMAGSWNWGTGSPSSSSTTPPGSTSGHAQQPGGRAASVESQPARFTPTHKKRSSYDLNKFIRSELSALKLQQQRGTAAPGEESAMARDRALTRMFPRRVKILKAHGNALAIAYPRYVCVFRMKDSVGWHIIFTSPRLTMPVGHIALNTKFGAQASEKMLAMSFVNGSVDLWSLQNSENGGAVKIGSFQLDVHIDKLFFIGSQLVALSKMGKVGIWQSMTQNWQVQEIGASIACYDTAGSSLILGCDNGSMYYVDMQKFPLRMKDNDLLVTELYKDPNGDSITAISVYLTPKTTVCGNWIEIAYGTSAGAVRVIVQHPETVGHGPQLFQTYTVHASPITRVALTTHHLISVCSEYNHVRSWGLTRFRGMISTQPGCNSLASFKVLSLESTDETMQSDYADAGPYYVEHSSPYGDQEGEQVFIQRVVPDSTQVFVRLASTGDRLCTIRSIDGSSITSYLVHECEGSTRIGCRPRRFLFMGTSTGSVQMWDLTTALDQYYATRSALGMGGAGSGASPAASLSSSSRGSQGGDRAEGPLISSGGKGLSPASFGLLSHSSSLVASLSGPSPQELLALIDECDLSCASCSSTPMPTPSASTVHLPGLMHHAHQS